MMKFLMHGDDTGKLVLRLTLGIFTLLHGIAKLTNPEAMTGISGMLTAKGLPAFIAYGAYIGEVLAPLLLIIGVFTRIGAALVVANMLFAIGLAHANQIFTMGKQGGWALELQGFYLFCGVALFFLGSGKFAVKPD
jgi:putative oxidoreductase